MIMSLMPVSSSDGDIGGVPSMPNQVILHKCSNMEYAWKRGESIVSA